MKIWESSHTFEHPWETVAQAAWRKYPNPLSPAVSSTDVTERAVGTDGVLKSRRLLATNWSIPDWVSRLIGLQNPSFAYEYSEVDPRERTMKLRSVNLNCTSYVSVEETLTYRPHPEDPSRTHMEQTAVITMQGIPLVSYCEKLMADAFSSNAQRGRQGLEWVIGSIKTELAQLERLSSKINHSMDALSHHNEPNPQQ